MRRIHFVPVLGSTKGLATTAIIPDSIKKKKKKKEVEEGEALTRRSLSQW